MGVFAVTAWELLRAASSLPSGTAWELLNSPKQGGLVINDGVAVEVQEVLVEAIISTEMIEAIVDDNQIVVELDDTSLEAEVLE